MMPPSQYPFTRGCPSGAVVRNRYFLTLGLQGPATNPSKVRDGNVIRLVRQPASLRSHHILVAAKPAVTNLHPIYLRSHPSDTFSTRRAMLPESLKRSQVAPTRSRGNTNKHYKPRHCQELYLTTQM